MEYYRLPLRNDVGAYNFSLELDGEVFYFAIRYNGRMAKWIMDIQDSEQNYIIAGQVLVLGCDLLSEYVNENKPQGVLLMYNTKEPNVDADRYALGQDAFLFYEGLT